jgi:hypothetical protein
VNVLHVKMMLDLEGSMGGVVLSSNFKTAAVYKNQPITLTVLLDVYVRHFRLEGDGDPHVFKTTAGTPVRQGYINRGNSAYHFLCIT